MAVETLDISSILKRAADKGGFVRTRYAEKDLPNSMTDITVFVHFGDMRSTMILSTMLLKRFREEMKGSKYFILCTWPGYECLFPYVNEYWAIKDQDRLWVEAVQFMNNSSQMPLIVRNLNYFFEEVLDASALKSYYDNGITQSFWDRFKHVKVTMPSVPSIAVLGPKFSKDMAKRAGYKILFYPALRVHHWSFSKMKWLKTTKEFWVALAKRLLREGFIPVVCHGRHTHDISPDLTDQCIYFEDEDVYKTLGVIRAADCTLDLFSGISRLAILARSPFMYFDERARHFSLKEYEVDGLCCSNLLPREYLWGFPNLLENGNLPLWENTLFANIIARLNKFLPNLDRNTWPTPSESTQIVRYDNVKLRKVQRFGARFIKVEKDT